jgi:hypothetical protein
MRYRRCQNLSSDKLSETSNNKQTYLLVSRHTSQLNMLRSQDSDQAAGWIKEKQF